MSVNTPSLSPDDAADPGLTVVVGWPDHALLLDLLDTFYDDAISPAESVRLAHLAVGHLRYRQQNGANREFNSR